LNRPGGTQLVVFNKDFIASAQKVHFAGFPVGDYWLIETDYDNYASIYTW
jgi:hypothetical protein